MVEGRKMTLRERGRRWGYPIGMRSGLGEPSGTEGSRGSFMAIEVSLLSGGSMMSYERSLSAFEGVYWGFNDTHFTEKLRECEGVQISRETVRKLRRGVGIEPKRRRRARDTAASGAQGAGRGDGALGWEPHHWLGPDQPACCLMAAIDDATGKLLVARFFLLKQFRVSVAPSRGGQAPWDSFGDVS